MVGFVPIPNEESEISGGLVVWDWNHGSSVHIKRAKPSGSPVHPGGGEVRVAADLILSLELVCVVRPWRDGAVSSQHPILPRILPLFDPIPKNKKVEHYDEE